MNQYRGNINFKSKSYLYTCRSTQAKSIKTSTTTNQALQLLVRSANPFSNIGISYKISLSGIQKTSDLKLFILIIVYYQIKLKAT